MKKIRERYKKLSQREKKAFLVRVISGSVFLLAGTIFGIVALALNGWDFIKFITNPTVDLIFLCLIALGVVMFARMEVK